jgi:type I restriction enzyme S subunit
MKKYPKYKASGIDWIGEIPENWEIKRLKYVSKITRGAILRPVDEPLYFDENGEWTYLNISDATICEKYLYEGKLKLSELGSTKSARVEPNNLIITASATIGKPFINKIPVCIHDGFIPITDLKVNLDFLYYYFKNPTLFSGLGKSNTQKNIYLEDVKNLDIPIPSLTEQAQIGKYIGYKMNQIETLINNKQKLIELLQEERTAIINKAVTKGIDSKTKLKPSGIEWLGDIPEHWIQSRIKYVCDIIGRIGFRGYTVADLVPKGKGAISLSPSNIKNQTLDINECTYLSWEKYNESPEIKIFKGDIIIVKTGSTIGKVAIVPEGQPEMTLNPQLVVMKNIQIDSRFLYYSMISDYFQGYFNIYSAGGSTPAISQEKINNFNIAYPSIEEQIKIADYIEDKNEKLAKLENQYKNEIELLKEYKTALISEVVTGKIDVRNEVIK